MHHDPPYPLFKGVNILKETSLVATMYCRFDLRICVYHTCAYCLGVTWYTQILISTSP